ncbi:MAG TPA: regulatory iron-sulfur-containing complex subunit RicT [Candidatus Dormibacteraeota bacterium]|jgi:cell fate regulator YaaT (PSP1 superfamily)|nr:regulatory iron-sulfur-containing complex subunit RicT [Candidatus Dormibacteraeota bacterium]
MPQVIGVKFRRNGPLNYYTAGEPPLAAGTQVVADTGRGPEIGTVVLEAAEVAPSLLPAELKPVERIVTEDDMRHKLELDAKAPEQVRVAKEHAESLSLDLKVVAATPSFDGQRILFDFSADGRVDFRELAKDLAGVFQCRVEMRQIYPRDEAKLQDGYGPCGRRLCCSSWLKEFVPVSIKHAKEQGLPLNPSRLNGMCGKLKCCLVYENEQYVEVKRTLPKVGAMVDLPEGQGVIRDINVPKELVMVWLPDIGAMQAVPAAQLAREDLATARSAGGGGGGGEGKRRRRRRGGGGGEGGGADPGGVEAGGPGGGAPEGNGNGAGGDAHGGEPA